MALYTRWASSGGSGESGTATFEEAPLPAGSVLVAFHFRNQAGSISTPAGWTKVGEDSTVSTRRAAIFMRRTDGTVNSITTTGSSVTWQTFLMAYTQNGPALSDGWAGASTSDFVSSITTPTITPTGYGVTVAAARFGNPITPTWGGGFEEVRAGASQFFVAERLGSTPTAASMSWGGDQQSMNLIAVHIPLGEAPLPKIELTASRASSTEVDLSWDDPGDAASVMLVRAAGTHTDDGNSRSPSHPEYDPTTIPGAATVATVDADASPHRDTVPEAGEYTYWIARADD